MLGLGHALQPLPLITLKLPVAVPPSPTMQLMRELCSCEEERPVSGKLGSAVSRGMKQPLQRPEPCRAGPHACPPVSTEAPGFPRLYSLRALTSLILT